MNAPDLPAQTDGEPELYYVRFWTDAARNDAERCLQRRISATSALLTTTRGGENEELLSYQDLFGFLVRRSRADLRAGEETMANAELVLADLLAQLLRGNVPNFVKRAAEHEKNSKNKKKSGRRPALTPLQRHQIERVDAVVALAGNNKIPRFGVEAAVLKAFSITETQLNHYRRNISCNSLIQVMQEHAFRLGDNQERETWAREVISDARTLFKLAAHNA